jgi:hypothetical protein
MTPAMLKPNGATELAQRQLDGSIGREVGLQHWKVAAVCLEVEPDDPIVPTERLAERAAEVADRASDEDYRPQVSACLLHHHRYPTPIT